MEYLIIILIILLLLSIINNFFMYKYSYKNICNDKFINLNDIPDDIKIKTITFFYKDKEYKKCHKNDFKNNNINYRCESEMKINNFLNSLNENKIKYNLNKNYNSQLQIKESILTSIRNL